MYSVRKKKIVKKPAVAISCVASANPSPLILKISSGASGLRWRSSLTTNAASRASAAGELADRLRRRPSRPSVPAPARTPAPASRRWPGRPRARRSSPAARGARSPSISRKTATSTSTHAIGLTNITHRQPGPSVRSPPSNTPAAEASPPIPPQTPSAVLRSEPSRNVVVRIDSAAGSIIAAPRPCAMRAATSSPDVSANPPISDETPTTTVPATSTCRRPSRSAARPPSNMNPP